MSSIFAAIILLLLSGLAFAAGAKPSSADTLSLLFLGLVGSLSWVPSLRKKLVASRDAATFFLIFAAVLIFQLAERAGPADGWALRLPVLPDDVFVMSYATRLAVLGALIGLPTLWSRSGAETDGTSGPEKYLLAALVLVGALGAATFWYLSRFYAVGPTEILDPTPMATLILQVVGYGGLAITCRAAVQCEKMRAWIFQLLPLVLIALWARHTFVAAPVEVDE